jgi:hypothetical protein
MASAGDVQSHGTKTGDRVSSKRLQASTVRRHLRAGLGEVVSCEKAVEITTSDGPGLQPSEAAHTRTQKGLNNGTRVPEMWTFGDGFQTLPRP